MGAKHNIPEAGRRIDPFDVKWMGVLTPRLYWSRLESTMGWERDGLAVLYYEEELRRNLAICQAFRHC